MTHGSFSLLTGRSRWPFSGAFREGSLPETSEFIDEEFMLDDPIKLATLRAFDNFRSGESCGLDFSCAERRSGIDRTRVGEVAIGGGDDGSVEVGEYRNELPCPWDIVREEAVEEEAVCVADDVDARASQEIGEFRASGDAGFRRSASEDRDERHTQSDTTGEDSRGPVKIDLVNQLNTFLILALPASPR